MEHTLEENVLTHFGGYEKNSLIHILNDDQELDAIFLCLNILIIILGYIP